MLWQRECFKTICLKTVAASFKPSTAPNPVCSPRFVESAVCQATGTETVSDALTLEQLWSVFLIPAVGAAAALLYAIAEVCYFRRIKGTEQTAKLERAVSMVKTAPLSWWARARGGGATPFVI